MGFQLGGAREQLSDQNGVIIDWIAQGVADATGVPTSNSVEVRHLTALVF
jgi:hypothetical protein